MTKIDKKIVEEFIDAAVKNHEKAELMLKQHPDLLNARWIHDETIIHFLAVEFYTDAVRFLGKLGFDVNAVNEFGDSPLIDVSIIGNFEMAKTLLELGADPNTTSETRDNVLHCAAQSGNAELVDLLIQNGAVANYKTDIGETIFDVIPNEVKQKQAILKVLEKSGVTKTMG